MYKDLLRYLSQTYSYLMRGTGTYTPRQIRGAQDWADALASHKLEICNPEGEKTSMADEADAKQIEMIRRHIEEATTYLLSIEIV
jgi:hypothetical protein